MNVIKLQDLPYGECCTFPKFNNNMLCMRLQTNQENVTIVINSGNNKLCKMLELETGTIRLVSPWTECIPRDAKVVVA